MLPVSMEEQVICFADKFFSKTRLEKEKSVEGALKSISKYGEDGIKRFNTWCERFLTQYFTIIKDNAGLSIQMGTLSQIAQIFEVKV